MAEPEQLGNTHAAGKFIRADHLHLRGRVRRVALGLRRGFDMNARAWLRDSLSVSLRRGGDTDTGPGAAAPLPRAVFDGGIGLDGGGFHRGRIQRLAQSFGLLRVDDRLFQQKIDRRKMRHRLERSLGRVVLFKE